MANEAIGDMVVEKAIAKGHPRRQPFPSLAQLGERLGHPLGSHPHQHRLNATLRSDTDHEFRHEAPIGGIIVLEIGDHANNPRPVLVEYVLEVGADDRSLQRGR